MNNKIFKNIFILLYKRDNNNFIKFLLYKLFKNNNNCIFVLKLFLKLHATILKRGLGYSQLFKSKICNEKKSMKNFLINSNKILLIALIIYLDKGVA